jgi:hypothetical protein
MNRKRLDKIKDSIQNTYDRYRKYQIRQKAKRSYKSFIRLYGEIERPDTAEYLKYWGRMSKHLDPTGYQIYYTLHGKKDIQMVPKEVYFSNIEPCLNDYTMSKMYRDKNNYERILKCKMFPHTYLRNMAGVYYDHDYKRINRQQVQDILKDLPKDRQKVLVKPSLTTGMRHKVRVIDFNKEKLTYEYLQEEYQQDFLIQEFVIQHEYFNDLGTTANIRMNTYRSVADNSIFIHDTRCGYNSGQGADRSQYGNDQVEIKRTGDLGEFSLNNKWQISRTAPNSGKQFSKMEPVPSYTALKKVATDIALLCPYHRRLGIDMIVDNNGNVVVYEVNFSLLGFNKSQYLIGGLFKEYTEEVIDYSIRNKESIHFPFTQ